MTVIEPIGGVFALEEPHGGELPHRGAYALSTGRACLTAMLQHLRPACVHVPYYTCNTVFQPFVDLDIPIRLYAVDARFRPLDLPVLKAGEFILWTNYFGLCGRTTKQLVARYGSRLLIDDSHAFFSGRHDGLWSFTSARKYFGVPDGAFLFAPVELAVDAPRFDRAFVRHAELRRVGKYAEAERAYTKYERTLDASIRRISAIGETLLRGCDAGRAARIRRENFAVVHARLAATNRIAVEMAEDDIPFCYPYLPERTANRAVLYRRNIFVPTLWTDAISRAVDGFSWERYVGKFLLPLPIDHRYGADDMRRLCDAVEAATQ